MMKEQRLAIEVNYNLGVAYYEKASYWAYGKAEEAFNKVLALYEKEPKEQADRELLALTHCGLVAITAQCSTRDGADLDTLWQDGQTHFRIAVSLVSEDSEIYMQAQYSLSLLYHLNRKDFNEARKILQKVLQINPYHWRAYTALGQMAMAEKQFNDAASYLEKATNLAPNFEFAYYQLGHAYSQRKVTELAKLKNMELAIYAYSKAPSIAGAHVGWGRVLASQNKDFEGAVAQFELAVELSSQHADAYADLAWYLAEGDLLVDTTNRQRAIDAAKRAVELTNHKDWRKLGTLGRIYYECGQVEAARRTLAEVRELKPDAPHVYYYQACVDFDEGKYVQARTQLITLFQAKHNENPEYWREKAEALMIEVKKALSE